MNYRLWVTTLLFSVAIAVTGCTIRWTEGGVGGSDSEATAGGGGGGQTTDTIPSEDEEIAAIEKVLANADPDALARAQYRGRYAAYALAGTAGEVLDQSTLDEATAQAFIDEWAPTIWTDAGAFVDALDSSLVPLALVKGSPECINEDCPFREDCAAAPGAKCILTGCGDGACPGCPEIFDLSKLAVKGWCSYTCVAGGQVVAIKVRIRLKLFGTLSDCLLLEKPVPCEGICM
ncbi:MAG: hypothetical protein R3B70_45995 [Polyangiaceae bacterium]